MSGVTVWNPISRMWDLTSLVLPLFENISFFAQPLFLLFFIILPLITNSLQTCEPFYPTIGFTTYPCLQTALGSWADGKQCGKTVIFTSHFGNLVDWDIVCTSKLGVGRAWSSSGEYFITLRLIGWFHFVETTCFAYILVDLTQMMKHKVCGVLGCMHTWLEGVFLGEQWESE